MNVIRKIKNFLPPSSRSFHQFRELEAERFDYLTRELKQSREQIEALLKSQANKLSDEIDAHDAHMKMFAWDTYRKPNETILEAKKRFFKELPLATGSSRLIQLGCAQLLQRFNEICTANELQYWAGGGTLIGAIRHGGFIPWDDDVDLCMARSNLEKLIEVISKSNEYKLSVVYDPFVLCRQYRFMFKDENIPCFLDVFPFDFSNDKKAKTKLVEIRERLKRTLSASGIYEEWLNEGCLESGHPLSFRVQEIIDAELYACMKKGLIAADNGEYFVRGIDNFDDPNGYHWSSRVDEIFPLERVPFEGTQIAVPRNYELLLSGAYGDIYELPKDIHSHFDHVADSILDLEETEIAIRSKLNNG